MKYIKEIYLGVVLVTLIVIAYEAYSIESYLTHSIIDIHVTNFSEIQSRY